MSYRFEKFNIWIESRKFIKDIYEIAKKFPKEEQYILGSQIKRAALSISLNIVEGSDKKSDKDFTRFLRISIGSLNETVGCLFVAKDLGYIEESSFNNIYDYTHKLSAMINAFIRRIEDGK